MGVGDCSSSHLPYSCVLRLTVAREMPVSRSPSASTQGLRSPKEEDIDPGPSLLTSLSRPSLPSNSSHPHQQPPSNPFSAPYSQQHDTAQAFQPAQSSHLQTRPLPIPADYQTPMYMGGAVTSAPPPPRVDLFLPLRKFNIHTKIAWTAIPAQEGFRVVELCRSLSSTTTSMAGGALAGELVRVPCYNRETIYDEEWQKHMKEVHGVFLLWPETWMRRVEVLDLEPFGGDIEACNDVMMG